MMITPAPLGMELGLVFNHSPGSIQARWETLSLQQDSCLWWRVRGKDTAPNAPPSRNSQHQMQKFHQRLGGDSEEEEEQKEEEGEEEGMLMEEKLCGGHYVKRM